jgi:hypothetical protein
MRDAAFDPTHGAFRAARLAIRDGALKICRRLPKKLHDDGSDVALPKGRVATLTARVRRGRR